MNFLLYFPFYGCSRSPNILIRNFCQKHTGAKKILVGVKSGAHKGKTQITLILGKQFFSAEMNEKF